MRLSAKDEIALSVYISSFTPCLSGYVRNSRVHVNEALTPQVVSTAFDEGHSISGYMAVPVGRTMMTHVGAIDFDMPGDESAKDVRKTLAEHGIESLLVESRRGAHLWIQTIGDGEDGSQPFGMVRAAVVREALQTAVDLTVKEGHDKVEVFPKRSRRRWGVGALRMPLMRHPKSGVIYPSHDPFDDAEVTGIYQLVNLMADLVTPHSVLRRLIGEKTTPDPYPRDTGLERRSYANSEDVPTISGLLRQHFGVETTPGRSVRCPFHDDEHASLSISSDDERCWCKAPACVLYNEGTGVGSKALAGYLRKESPIASRDT